MYDANCKVTNAACASLPNLSTMSKTSPAAKHLAAKLAEHPHGQLETAAVTAGNLYRQLNLPLQAKQIIKMK